MDSHLDAAYKYSVITKVLRKLAGYVLGALFVVFAAVVFSLLLLYAFAASIWDWIAELYIGRFRPDLVERQKEMDRSMDRRIDLVFLLSEMKESNKPWSEEELLAYFSRSEADTPLEECLTLAKEENYLVYQDSQWKLTEEGATFTEEYFASFR